MLEEKLIEINELLDILGYSDLRSVKTWANKNKIPLITIGKKVYCVRNIIDLIIENKINSYINNNFENPSEVLEAVKANDSVKLSQLLESPPVDKEAKIKIVKNKNEMSKASKSLLNKLKSA